MTEAQRLFILQVIKIAVPVFNGAKYQCERLPRAAVALALKQYQDHHETKAAAYVFSISADARADAPRQQCSNSMPYRVTA